MFAKPKQAMRPDDLLRRRISDFFGSAEISFSISAPESNFGDYATNAALVAAKAQKQQPMAIAEKLALLLNNDPEIKKCFSEINAVKPGFINARLSEGYLLSVLKSVNEHPEAFGARPEKKEGLVLVEYFQLNVAKPPHIAHLRSAVIGDSLKRVFKALGYKTVSDTHIGDWGTQFGILLWAYKNLNGREQVKDNPLEELNGLYVEANNLIEQNPDIREKAKAEFAELELGDRENRKLWQFFISVSDKEFKKMVSQLKLLPFEYHLGESFFEKLMPEVLEKLGSKGLLKTGETGERYVDLEAYNLGRFIAIKTDRATTYGLRDLAALYYRYEILPKKEKAELLKNIYVVDNRQSHHLAQAFKVFELMNDHDAVKSVHVDFGFMSLPEGAISTRKGNTISLEKLLDEANRRALDIINEKNPGLNKKEEVAKMVGLGAIKYADLSHNRKQDLVFRWDEVLNFDGDTGPYLQYTHARLKSILRRADINVKKVDYEKLGEAEVKILRALVHFPEIVERTAAEFMPNILAKYLYELASAANNFYHSAPVLQEQNEDLKKLRLAVVAGVATVLQNGLYLLGIDAPEEM